MLSERLTGLIDNKSSVEHKARLGGGLFLLVAVWFPAEFPFT